MTRRLVVFTLAILAVPHQLQAQDEAVPIEGLVVTGSATPRPVDALATHVTVLQGVTLREAGITRVQDALRGIPGIAVVENGGYGAATSLFMRGAESDHVLVLVDGVQVNLPGGSFDFAGLTTDNVARIEVVRGPASALYGSDALAGVIHVITRTGDVRERGTVSVAGGSFGTLEFSGGLRGGGEVAGYSLSLARRSTDGVLPVNNNSSHTVLSATGRFAPDEETGVRVSLRLVDRAYHFPTDGSGAGDDTNAFTFGDESVVGITADRRLTSALTLSATLGVSELDGGTDDAPDGPADTLGFFGFKSLDHVRRSTVDVRGSVGLGPATLTLGGELEEERQRSFTSSLSQYGNSGDESEHGRWNRATYAHLTGEEGPVAFNLGGRVEDNERFGRLATWQAGVRLRVEEAEGLLLRASLGKGIKEPTFYENFATGFAVGNPELAPERSRSWEVGLEQGLFGGAVTLSATHFRQYLEDLIQYTFSPPTPGGANYFNVAAADVLGTEVAVDLSGGRWSMSASWTHLDTEVVDAGFDEGPDAAFAQGRRLLRRPAHTLAASGSLGFTPGGSLSLSFRRVGARDDRDFASFPAARVTLPAHVVAGLAAVVPLSALTATDGVALTLRGENLLDERYEEVAGYPAPGRRLVVGFRMEFGG